MDPATAAPAVSAEYRRLVDLASRGQAAQPPTDAELAALGRTRQQFDDDVAVVQAAADLATEFEALLFLQEQSSDSNERTLAAALQLFADIQAAIIRRANQQAAYVRMAAIVGAMTSDLGSEAVLPFQARLDSVRARIVALDAKVAALTLSVKLTQPANPTPA